ncbi:Aldehyde dehydrogenase family protein OS=Streptomyces cyaneofuscatus OX=66883 GN=G3I52_03705 PE=3 SV=1 [Streptomyces cyaneofuscatus]
MPVSFELGGKNAGLVSADADLERAVEGTIASAFTNSGQVCLCTERVYVQREVFDDFAAALAARAKQLVIGSRPRDEGTGLGPLVSAEHRAKVLGYYGQAAADGAVLAGGGVPEFGDDRDGGFFVEPTVLAGLPETHPVVREEIFDGGAPGPVRYRGRGGAAGQRQPLRPGGDARHDLNVSRAHRVAPRLEVGIAWVNCWNLRDLRHPLAGRGSGIGREGGAHSLDFFPEPTNVCVEL